MNKTFKIPVIAEFEKFKNDFTNILSGKENTQVKKDPIIELGHVGLDTLLLAGFVKAFKYHDVKPTKIKEYMDDIFSTLNAVMQGVKDLPYYVETNSPKEKYLRQILKNLCEIKLGPKVNYELLQVGYTDFKERQDKLNEFFHKCNRVIDAKVSGLEYEN